MSDTERKDSVKSSEKDELEKSDSIEKRSHLDSIAGSEKLPPYEGYSSTAKLADSLSKSQDTLADKDSFDEDDIFKQREIEHPNTAMGALAHLLKSSLGSGILAMPMAFKNAGMTFGMVGTIVIGFICTHCVQMLVESSHTLCRRMKIPSLGFAETAEAAFSSGPKGIRKFSGVARAATKFSLCLTYYSANTVYVVFIATNIKQVADYYMECHELNIRIWIVIMLVPLIAICMIKELKYLVPFSMIANLFIIISFAITLYYVFVDLPNIDTVPSPHFAGWDKIPLFFSTVVFAMEGIGTVMPIENSMKKPKKFIGCPGVLNTAMTVVVLLYALLGFFGYWRFQDKTDGSITLNLPKEDVLAQVVKVLIAIAIYFTYPLQFTVPTAIVWELLKPKFSEKYHTVAHYGQRIITVTLTVALAVAVPNLGPIISLVGAVCFSILGLLLPAIIETACRYENQLGRFKWRMWKNLLIGIFSIIGLISGAYASILDIIKEYTPCEENCPTEAPSVCNGTSYFFNIH